jgi:catechol 2,3-dioxygenase-like lactoylglutathione lyase family enzyme
MKIGGFATLLQVFDMSTSLAFYRDVLGFQVVSEVPADGRCDWVLLRLHETELMLNTAYEAEERPAVPDASRVAAHADTALFFDCEDVDVAYATLRDRVPDVKPPIVRDYGMKQLYLKDPDGYEICLQHPVNQGSG